VDRATLEVSFVADDAAIPDDSVECGRAMNDGSVLNGGLATDANRTEIASQDGGGPHAGLWSDRDVANDDGLRVDERRGVN
jgi:hypothetical protein